MQMGLLNWLGFNKPRDAPSLPDIRDNVRDSGNLFVFGMTHSGERVDERTAMQIVTVYACVRLLSNTIADLSNQPELSEFKTMRKCVQSSGKTLL